MSEAILKIEGGLKVAGQSLFPRPGKVDFRIEGAEKLIGKLLSIDAGALPQVATQDHLEGKIVIEIFAKKIDNLAGVSPVPKGRVPKTRTPKPEIKDGEKDAIQQATSDSE